MLNAWLGSVPREPGSALRVGQQWRGFRASRCACQRNAHDAPCAASFFAVGVYACESKKCTFSGAEHSTQREPGRGEARLFPTGQAGAQSNNAIWTCVWAKGATTTPTRGR